MSVHVPLDHPQRHEYASDVDWLNACLVYLDRLFPKRIELRAAAWHRMREDDPQHVRDSLVALILKPDWTDKDEREFDRLVIEWRTISAHDRRLKKASDR